MMHDARKAIGVDAERARAFVLAHGGPREAARLASLFGAPQPPREAVKALEALQNPDGGFPARQQPGAPSSLDTTCYVLAELKDMPPLAGSPMASRAVSFLRRMQGVDGSWQEPAEVAASPWAQPDEPQAQAYLTANAVYTIFTLDPEHLDPVRRGIAWLKQALAGAEAVRGRYAQTLALAGAVCYRLDGPGSPEAVRWLRAALDQAQEAADLAWVLTCTLEAGVGGPLLLPVVHGLERLAALQRSDGSWPGEAAFALEATLDSTLASTLAALRVFRGYGVI
jgi:hypothetical protein